MKQKLAIGWAARSTSGESSSSTNPGLDLLPSRPSWSEIMLASPKSVGRTIFVYEQNLDQADSLCGRIAVFKSHLRVVDRQFGPSRIYGKQVVSHLGQLAADFLEAAFKHRPVIFTVAFLPLFFVVVPADTITGMSQAVAP